MRENLMRQAYTLGQIAFLGDDPCAPEFDPEYQKLITKMAFDEYMPLYRNWLNGYNCKKLDIKEMGEI